MRDAKGRFVYFPGKGAPRGNKNGTKLKDADVRQQAYKSYCEWISQGKTKEAWVFEHPSLSCTSKTMERYIRENPLEFPLIHKEIAEAKSYEIWLETGKQMMLGEISKCQPAIYQMFMRNKFGWDKNTQITHTFEPEARRLLTLWEEEE